MSTGVAIYLDIGLSLLGGDNLFSAWPSTGPVADCVGVPPEAQSTSAKQTPRLKKNAQKNLPLFKKHKYKTPWFCNESQVCQTHWMHRSSNRLRNPKQNQNTKPRWTEVKKAIYSKRREMNLHGFWPDRVMEDFITFGSIGGLRSVDQSSHPLTEEPVPQERHCTCWTVVFDSG